MIDDYTILQFKKDIDFILEHRHNWIFKPIFEITRRLVLYYISSYETEEQNR